MVKYFQLDNSFWAFKGKSMFSFFRNISNKQIFTIFLLAGLLIYGNSLFNNFIGDDYALVKNNRTIRSIWNIPKLFKQGAFYEGNISQNQLVNFYRPVLSTTYATIYIFSRDHTFGYHLVQLLLHVLNTFLIFQIFTFFLDKKYSFVFAMIFLSHPLNTEAVVYISVIQESLFVFFGLLAFYINTKRELSSFIDISLISLLLTLSLLSKEAGIVFLIIVPVFNFMYKKKEGIKSVLPSIISFLVYLFLRLGVAQIYLHNDIIVPIQTLSLWDRMLHIPKIVFFYLKTFVYPKDLYVFQSWTIDFPSANNFYLPLLVDVGAILLLSIFGLWINKKHRASFNNFLFLSLWLVTGLGIHLHLIPLDQTVADRWFYFPMIGLLGIIGMLATHINLKNSKLKKILPLLVIVVIIAFSTRVVIRNTNWKNRLTLYTHDLKYDGNSHQLESGLGYVYFGQGKPEEAEIHHLRATEIFPHTVTYSPLGIFYLATEDFEKAEKSFGVSLDYNPNHVTSWAYLAISKYKLGNKRGALEAAKKAYSISPGKFTSRLIRAIENDTEIQL